MDAPRDSGVAAVLQQGMRELLLSVNQTGWRPRTNTTRQEGAQETCRKINALRPILKV